MGDQKLKYRCLSCGAELEIDESSKACPYCKTEISPENDGTGTLGHALKLKSEKDKYLADLVDAYAKSGNSKDIHKVISSYDEYVKLFDIDRIWRAFVINAAGAAVHAKDGELQVFLKNHSKEYDSKRENSNLFRSILFSYPKFGTNNDWEDLIHATCGDREQFAVICDSIIQYIAKEKDKAFAIDIFTLINAKGKDWKNIGRYYIRAFLSNEEIAENVFTASAFNGAARRFAKQLSAYCKTHFGDENGLAIEETKVWKNYVDACRAYKKRLIIFSSAALVCAMGIVLAIVLSLNAVNKDTVAFSGDKVIEVIYGDSLDLEGYTYSYNRVSGKAETEPLTEKMLFGYDPELVGAQQNAYFEFKGVQYPVIIIVKMNQLDAPKTSQSGNRIVWDAVPNAKSYEVYVNASAEATFSTDGLICDLSEYAGYGELTVTVKAISDGKKFDSSPMSAPITATKLEAPKNIAYSGGKLTWSAVSGATGYELKVNGTPYTSTTNECALPFIKGDNEVSVTATSSDPTVVHGVAKETVYYNKLSPITSMNYKSGTVSWSADTDAKAFAVYVDGAYWKDFSRSNFSVGTDGFTDTFGNGAHKIEIVCKTSVLGVESSDKFGYNVIFGNSVSVADGVVSWTSLGAGSTYFVTVGGVVHTYGDSFFSLSDCTWAEGANEVSVTAKHDGEEYVCESFTLTKHHRPTVSVSDSGWTCTDGTLVSVDGGEWSATLPDVAALSEGVHTARAKISAKNSFELDSEEITFTVMKLAAPVVRLSGGKIESSHDTALYKLNLEYYDTAAAKWLPIDSEQALTHPGSYTLRARLTALPGATEHTFYLTSAYSSEFEAIKPSAPDISYDSALGLVSSSVPGAKFYYTDESGEHELVGGKISSLPGGVFSVYARLDATEDGYLNSENTPESQRVSVFNLDVEFIVTPQAGTNLCTFVFKGCDDVDFITFSYKINYLDANGNVIGGIDKSDTSVTANKTQAGSSNCVKQINYRLEGTFKDGNTHKDVAKIEVIVYINGGSEILQKTYTVSV